MNKTVKAWLAVVGGMIIHFSLGGIYTIGNLNPYVTSYIRARSGPATLRLIDTTWLGGVGAFFHCLTMFVAGFSMRALGARITSLIGSLIISASVMVSYFTIKWSFAGLLLTYGVLYGFGVGMCYSIPVACAIQWLPQKKGLVTGLVLAGFGGGAFVVTQIQTGFINPGNLVPDYPANMTVPRYFSQDELLDRVPYVFLILGGCYLVLQGIATPMLSVPNDQENKETLPLLEKKEDIDHPCISDKDIHDDNQNETKGKNSRLDFSPLEMLRTRYFWMLWFIFFLNGQSISAATALYKVYAQSYLQDDFFLGVVGSFANAFNSAGRIVWGFLSDKFSFRTTMMAVCASTIILFLTFLAAPLSPEGHRPMTFIWVCLIFFTYSGNFPLLSAAISDTFGNKYLATNIGLAFTTQAVSGPLGSVLAITILPRISWAGLFSVVSGCSFIAFILAFFYDAKKPAGKRM